MNHMVACEVGKLPLPQYVKIGSGKYTALLK